MSAPSLGVAFLSTSQRSPAPPRLGLIIGLDRRDDLVADEGVARASAAWKARGSRPPLGPRPGSGSGRLEGLVGQLLRRTKASSASRRDACSAHLLTRGSLPAVS